MKIIFKYLYKIIIPGSVAISLVSGISYGQDKLYEQQKKGAVIQLTYNKKADLGKIAVVKVIAIENDNMRYPANDLRINFYIQKNSEQEFVNYAYTDAKGNASAELPGNLPVDAAGFFRIIAKIENDSIFNNAEEEVQYKEANIVIHLHTQDTLKVVKVKVTETSNNGKENPVAGKDVKFYVQRTFGILPAAEENSITTDENGEAIFYFLKDIPGDSVGNICIIARMEDDDDYGNLETKAVVKWGTQLSLEKAPFPRELWGPKAPLPLIVTITVLFGGVWISYFFIFYQLNKIKNE